MEERLKPLLPFIQDLIKFAETKNAVLVALNGGAILAVLKLISENKFFYNWVIYYFWSFIFFASLGLLIALLSFFPRVKMPWVICEGDPLPNDNLILFSDICKYNERQYLTALYTAVGEKKQDFSPFETFYANQLIVNSRIAMRKYTLFRKALWCTVSAILTPIFGFLLLFLLED